MDAESARGGGGSPSLGWQQEAARALPDRRLRDRTLSDSESEDVLHAVDPNDVFGGGGGAAPPSVAGPAPLPVYQLVHDLGEEAESAGVDVIAIQLDPWSTHHSLSEACAVGEPPPGREATVTPTDAGASGALHLTAEEEKLLSEEGVSLPDRLPLTKAEERVLKKVRRKIRNKRSAQDSRRRRKEYVHGLEDRAALCSAQNKDLQKKVEQLEKQNMSLLTQLRHLQSLVKRSVSKGAQTSTCLLIIFISLTLIMLPSLSPFSRRSPADQDDRPVGVLSRNILTDFAPSPPSDETPVRSDVGQSEAGAGQAVRNLDGGPSNETANGSSEAPAPRLAAAAPRADEM